MNTDGGGGGRDELARFQTLQSYIPQFSGFSILWQCFRLPRRIRLFRVWPRLDLIHCSSARVARTYNSPSWTRHAFFRLISNSLSRRCTVYTSLIITRVRFFSNYHHRFISNLGSSQQKPRRENLLFFRFYDNLFFTRTLNNFLSLNLYDKYEVRSGRKKDLERFHLFSRWCYNSAVSVIFQVKFLKTFLRGHRSESISQNYKIAKFQRIYGE